MRISTKYSNLLFSGLLSAIMTTIVSGAVVLASQGLTSVVSVINHFAARISFREMAGLWFTGQRLTGPSVVLQKSLGGSQ